MDVITRVKKRKRSMDNSIVMCPQQKAQKMSPPKARAPESALSKSTPKSTTSKDQAKCPLVQTLRQYGLLESIVSCLLPRDLLSLALSCKATYNAMFPRPGSLDNLLSKVSCSGQGISMRQRKHIKSTFFYAYDCTEFAQCSATTPSQPCVTCKVTTCNECRIHAVYQTIYEAPSCSDDLPNFSGFVLLHPDEVAILSPHHLPSDPHCNALWQNPSSNPDCGPYHDQGFLDVPLEANEPATPEDLSEVLALDLGVVSLRTWSSSSAFGFPSPALRSLSQTVEARKLMLCDSCFEDAEEGYQTLKPALPRMAWLDGEHGLQECHCSLRGKVVDKWQCVKCYSEEDAIITSITSAAEQASRLCRCGSSATHSVCLWCWGAVTEGRVLSEEGSV